jgi:hypothetical protein
VKAVVQDASKETNVMKRTIVIALFFAASLMLTQNAPAQVLQQGHYLTMGYAAQAQAVCSVNGVDYPVDGYSRIWGQDPVTGRWFVIGRIVATTYGYRADGIDGRSWPAYCR